MFDRLFAPIAIGPVTVRNRILSTGHATGYAEDGQPGDRELAYNVAKARGGAGLIVFGGTTSVHRQSPARGLHLIANRDDSTHALPVVSRRIGLAASGGRHREPREEGPAAEPHRAAPAGASNAGGVASVAAARLIQRHCPCRFSKNARWPTGL